MTARNRPVGLSTLRRWDATRQALAMPRPIQTQPRAPFMRAFLLFLAAVAVLSIGAGITWHVRQQVPQQAAALPGASKEIEEAYQRGLDAGRTEKRKVNLLDWSCPR